MVNVLGIHAAFTARSHDSSCALVIDGEVVFATEEERLSRRKSSVGYFPRLAVSAALKYASLDIRDIDLIVIDGTTYPGLARKVQRYLLHNFGACPEIETIPHHDAHAAGAFLSTSMPDALVVSADGLGDGLSTMVCEVSRKPTDLDLVRRYVAGWEESLGLFYSAFTQYLGFSTNDGEYKVMGMAAYGEPTTEFNDLLAYDSTSGLLLPQDIHRLYDRDLFSSIDEPYCSSDFIADFTGVTRPDGGSFRQEHFDLAASVQAHFSHCYLGLIKHHLRETGRKRLCLSGGTALNALANKALLDESLDEVYVMPAASDRGLSLGSALLGSLRSGDHPQPVSDMYLGREFSTEDVAQQLSTFGLSFQTVDDPAEACCEDIIRGKVVGWFQGRSEFGPRALGARSILASPSQVGMQETLNAKIKFRESFRPFAPAMLTSELPREGPTVDLSFMTFTLDVPKSLETHLTEATHVDGTARFQVVNDAAPGPFPSLLNRLKAESGFGGVINTSFNLAGEPIVDSPSDALRTFFSSGLDTLYLGALKLTKE